MTKKSEPYGLLAIVIGAIVSGQMVLKTGIATLYKPTAFTGSELSRMAFYNLTNPYMIFSLGCTFVAGITWIMVVQRMPMSKAYPLISSNYFLVYLLSWLVFGEQISLTSFVGIILIGCGTFLLGKREQKSATFSKINLARKDILEQTVLRTNEHHEKQKKTGDRL